MQISTDPRTIANIIQEGGVVAYPTEGVFGLGCDPQNAEAIQKILKLKQRPIEKGLILLASERSQLSPYLSSLPDQLEKQLTDTWPGPVTWILPCPSAISRLIRGDHKSIACRVSAHEHANSLAKACGHPIISTSANPAGAEPARTTADVLAYFASSELDAIFDQAVGNNVNPTEIRDGLSGKIIRSA